MGHLALALVSVSGIVSIAGLTPPGDVEYVVERRGAVALEAPEGAAVLARAAFEVFEEARPRVEDALGVPVVRGSLRITIAPHRGEFDRIVSEATRGREPPHRALAVAIPHVSRIVILASSLEPLTDNSLPTTMRHELVHIALSRDSGGKPLRVPRWLDEGLAEHVGGRPLRPRQRATLRAAARGGTLPRLSSLDRRFPRDEDASFAYSLSLSFVRYSAGRFGSGALRDVVGHVVRGVPIDAAWERATGFPLLVTEGDWREALKEDSGWLKDYVLDPENFWQALFTGIAFLAIVAYLVRGVRRRRLLRQMDLEDEYGPRT